MGFFRVRVSYKWGWGGVLPVFLSNFGKKGPPIILLIFASRIFEAVMDF